LNKLAEAIEDKALEVGVRIELQRLSKGDFEPHFLDEYAQGFTLARIGGKYLSSNFRYRNP